MIKEIDNLKQEALDPNQSIIVESCAGSGKTWLLVSRIIRLLLDDVPPAEILAVTFTRKAAQQMEKNLYDWLHQLAISKTTVVRELLIERGIPVSEVNAQIPKAQNLLRKVLISRPGVTISTLHSWFLNILRHAPLTNFSGVSSKLTEEEFPLFDEAWGEFSRSLENNPHSKEAMALAGLINEYGLANSRNLIENFLAKRIEWWTYIWREKYPVEVALEKSTTKSQLELEEDHISNLMNDDAFLAEIKKYEILLSSINTATARKHCSHIRSSLKSIDKESAFYKLLHSVYLKTPPNQLRIFDSNAQRKLVGDGKMNDLNKAQKHIAKKLIRVKEKVQEKKFYRLCEAVFICGEDVLASYQRLKEQKNLIDYSDIEWRTRNLISESQDADYVQYKLDVRYNHVLVDELQDTNPTQWAIIKSWLESSKSGGNKLTFFGVGDQKQSIYRFRGAEPKIFEVCKKYFTENYHAKILSNVVARRNARKIVLLVNKVFEKSCINFKRHKSFRKSVQGQVVVIPLAGRDSVNNSESFGWRNPLSSGFLEDIKKVDRSVEAEDLAKKIMYIVGNWQVTEEEGLRPARFSDILILVRSRVHLEVYEKNLASLHIPFVGAWQGGLLKAREVLDMISLLRFLSNQTSDLDLAVVLKSPIVMATDDDLLEISKIDEGEHWWGRLGVLVDSGKANPQLCRAYALLNDWIRLVDTLPVHDLLDKIFYDSQLITKYQDKVPSSLTNSVISNLQKFLELSLMTDSGRYPSLNGFLENLSQLARIEKFKPREAPSLGNQSGLNAVRILTVHGAKGLEAPIVWLIDCNTSDKTVKSPFSTLVKWDVEKAKPEYFSVYARKNELTMEQSKIIDLDNDEVKKENERLLYVALTRAKDTLVVSGSGDLEDNSWYQRIADAAAKLNIEDYKTYFNKTIQINPIVNGSLPTKIVIPKINTTEIGKRVLSSNHNEKEFGINLHQLLELLIPPSPGGSRDQIRYKLHPIPRKQFDAIWDAAQGILQAESLQEYINPIFYKRAWNEISFSEPDGTIRRIDRVVEFEDRICVIDYKTGIGGVASSQDIKIEYQNQLRSYCRAITEIFKGKKTFGLIVSLQGKIALEIEN